MLFPVVIVTFLYFCAGVGFAVYGYRLLQAITTLQASSSSDHRALSTISAHLLVILTCAMPVVALLTLAFAIFFSDTSCTSRSTSRSMLRKSNKSSKRSYSSNSSNSSTSKTNKRHTTSVVNPVILLSPIWIHLLALMVTWVVVMDDLPEIFYYAETGFQPSIETSMAMYRQYY